VIASEKSSARPQQGQYCGNKVSLSLIVGYDQTDGRSYLIVGWSPALLKMELDRWFWKDQDHVSIKKVWEAICAYSAEAA
jgi:hypothetical protein